MHVLHRTQHSFSRIKVYYSCPSCIAGNIAALRFVGSRFSHSTSSPSPPLASWLEFPCEVATRRPRGALVGCGVPGPGCALRSPLLAAFRLVGVSFWRSFEDISVHLSRHGKCFVIWYDSGCQSLRNQMSKNGTLVYAGGDARVKNIRFFAQFDVKSRSWLMDG